jgi:hypothetical protein
VEHRLRVFENRVLRRIFGPRRDEVAGGWRKLLEEELHNWFFSPSIISGQVKEDLMGRAFSTNREEEERMWVIGGKARRTRPLRRPRCGWKILKLILNRLR